MCSERVIVLKFGGSVLRDATSVRKVGHEIYRWRREGWKVVAVVSALAGRTDALLGQARGDAGSAHDLAFALGQGERDASALLLTQLERIGLPACCATPEEVGLVAEGDPLDATPVSLGDTELRARLDRDGVVVFPGFVAIDREGRHVTLGRGGSDLTALFLAHALGAEKCRLVKDVDGLYTADPNDRTNAPARFTTCSYDDALATDGSIVQHKSVRFAQRVGLTFELGGFNGVHPTTVGEPSHVDVRAHPAPPLGVAVAGAGTVGGGVLSLIRELPELFEVKGVACRDPGKHPELGELGVPVVQDAMSLVDGADVVVEVIGGTETALELARSALGAGRDVVTANKALLAEHGAALRKLADERGCDILDAASVGGGVAVVERATAAPVRRIRGVLNGTGNFVLEEVRLGASQQDAVRRAQELGLAEADPSRDLDGRDVIDKLRVLAQRTGLGAGQGVERTPIPEDGLENAAAFRYRYVGTLDSAGARASVERVEPGDPLFDLPGATNAVVIERDDGSVETLRGLGAGRWPTAESVVADLLSLARTRSGALAHV